MAPKIYRLSSSGAWEQLKKLYRLSSSGTWEALKKVWRLSSSGVWEIIFSALSTPSVKSATKPLLYFRDTGGYETASSEIAAATGSNLTSPAAYDGDKVFLIRGNWNEEPISFYMRIQKSQSAGFSSGVTTVNGSSSVTRTYATYSDSNYADEVPLSSANRYTITKADVRDGYYFRGYIEATNDTNLMGSYSTEVVLPRMYANVSFIQNLDGSYGTNLQSNGGTFSWSYTGNGTIQAQDISEQLFLVYPLNNTSGNALYSTAIFAGTGTSSPTSTVTFTSANLNPNTEYTIVIKTTMQDGWSANSNNALRTIITDQKSFTTASAKPLAPTNVTATDVGTDRPYGDGAVSLSWTQPSNGTTISGYKIEYTQGPGYITYVTLVNDTGNNTTSGTFTGLSSNTNYKFRVTAIGSQADSDPSADSNSVLITTVPSAPTGATAIAGNAEATVEFNAPAFTGGKSISQYRATSSPDSITATDIITQITVTGLTNYTPYTFTVAARNANGWSAESTATSSVTPKLPAPVGSGTVTIASDANTNYIYKITAYGTWSNSATTYDYEWQTSSDGGTTWITRSSGTDVSTIPNYNAFNHKTHNIRLRVYGRNQTGPAITPLVSNTLTIFYTIPVINTFTVTGGELTASYSYTYSADDPLPSVSLEYKLSTASTWTSVISPSSPGTVTLPAGTYDFRLSITNSANGAFRVATSTVSSIVVSNIYSFSFGNVLYPSTNGHIGLTAGSTTNIPTTGKYLAIFTGDFVGNTGATPGYMLAWSDSTKYVIRFDGYRFGFVGQAAYRLEWMATFYSNQSYVDIKIINKGSSISGAVTSGLYKDGTLVAGLPGPYTLSTGSTFRINFDGSTGSFGITYDEISITSPNDIMNTAGTLTGTNDDGYYTITTSTNYYKSPVVTIGTLSGGTSTLSIPFTESNGCDSVAYDVRTGSYSGTVVQSSSILSSPISLSSLSANTTYYITLTPFNYKNQSGSVAQVSATTAPPQPTVTFSNVTSSSFTVSWSATGATHYYVDIFNSISGVSLSGYPTSATTNTSASPFGLSQNTSYTVSVYARNSSTGFLGDVRTVSQTTLISGLTPVFGTNTRTSGGFSGSVTNYDSNYTWSLSTSSGTVTPTAFSGTGTTKTFSVTGLTAGSSATVTVTTSRSGYDNGSGTTTGQALSNLITNPAYGTATRTNGGFTASISTSPNPTGGSYSVVSQTNGSASVNSSTGALTVTGLTAGQSSTVTVRYSLSGYNSVDITSTGQALSNLTTNPAYGTATSAVGGWSATISTNPSPTGGSYSVVSQTAGSASVNSTTGALTASGLTAGQSSTVTVRYSLSGYNSVDITASGSALGAPSGGVVGTPTLSSGTALRVGAVYAVNITTEATGATGKSYQWQYFTNTTSTWVNITGETATTYTLKYTEVSGTIDMPGRRIRCRVTWTNGAGSFTPSDANIGEITMDLPTITNVVSYYYSTASRTATKANGYPQRPPGTGGTFFVVWYAEGYNMQGMNSRTIIGTTSTNGTVQAGTTASDSLNIYSSSQTIGDGTSYTGGIYRNTGAGGNTQWYALRLQPSSRPQGQGSIGQAKLTNTVQNSTTNQTNSPITNSLTNITAAQFSA